MRVAKRNVYYCDFCKKHSLRSLVVHEKHCTANPDRECRLCESGKSVSPIIKKYSTMFELQDRVDAKIFGWGGGYTPAIVFKTEFTLKDIIKELDYQCPNCILTILRCLGVTKYCLENRFKYDYKKALANWWRIQREAQWDAIYE